MGIEPLHPGARMSQAAILNGIVYLAGQVGAPGEDHATQTHAELDFCPIIDKCEKLAVTRIESRPDAV